MRKILFLTSLFILTGCGSIGELNRNMASANELMLENIESMEQSRAVIEENSHQIERSTNAMRSFQFVFPIFFSMLLLLFIYILFRLSRSIIKKSK